MRRTPRSAAVRSPCTQPHASDGRVNRYYDPASYQFLSIDPKVGTTMEPYAFTAGDPLNSTDPLGLSPQHGNRNVEHSRFRGRSTESLRKEYDGLKGKKKLTREQKDLREALKTTLKGRGNYGSSAQKAVPVNLGPPSSEQWFSPSGWKLPPPAVVAGGVSVLAIGVIALLILGSPVGA